MKSVAQLTPKDVEVLKDEKRIGVFFSVIILFLGLSFSLVYSLVNLGSKVLFLSSVIVAFSLVLSVIIYFMVNYKVILDIKSNQKELIIDLIQDKQKVVSDEVESGAFFVPVLGALFARFSGQMMKSTHRYYFIIKNVRYEVDEGIYNKVEVGDIVQRHCAKQSRIVFMFELVL